jgi:hypothetical protein
VQLPLDIIARLEMLEQNEEGTDDKDSDLKFNLKWHFKTMVLNLTKLYSFFCDGNWEVNDSNLIVDKRDAGLKELKKIYKAH